MGNKNSKPQNMSTKAASTAAAAAGGAAAGAHGEFSPNPSEARRAAAEQQHPGMTTAASEALAAASHLAFTKGSTFCGTEHLLYGLLTVAPESSGSVPTFLASCAPAPAPTPADLARRLSAEVMVLIDFTASATAAVDAADAYTPSLAYSLQLATYFCRTRASALISETALLFAVLSLSERCQKPNAVARLLTDFFRGTPSVAEIYRSLAQTEPHLTASFTAEIPACVVFAGVAPQWQDPVPVPSTPENASFAADPPSNNYSSAISDTHWVVPGRLMAGQSPGYWSDEQLVAAVNHLGVNVFVCLQESYDHSRRNYPRVIRDLVASGRITKARGGQVRFLLCPIPDFHVLERDSDLLALITEIQTALSASGPRHVIYVHCRSGHGRTGTVLVSLLQALEAGTKREAMARLVRCHAARGCGWCPLSGRNAHLEDDSQEAQTDRVEHVMHTRQPYVHGKK